MAAPPPAKPVQRDPPKSTSLVSTVAGKRVVSVVRSVVATIKRPTFIVEHMENHTLLTKMLNDLVSFVDHATEPAAASPLLSCVILQDIDFLTAPSSQYLKHGLGRPFIGFICVNAFVADWSGRRIALAAGLSASTHIGIRSTNAGRYSFLVF